MIYCAATENGFESISDNSINVFLPTYGRDDDGNMIVTEPAKAKVSDFIALAIAGIIAAYAMSNEEAPINMDDVLYHINAKERDELLTAIIELRADWYGIPKVVAEELEKEAENIEEGEQEKNA